MPLDAEHEPVTRVLDRLDRAVLRPRGRHQALAERLHGLVVEGVDLHRGASERRPQPALRRGLDAMGRDAAVLGLAVLDAVADDVGKMLVQGPAARDVQQLHAAADAEDRKLAAVGGANQRELDRVDPRLGRPELGVGLGAVCARLHVGAAGQAHAVDAVEQRRRSRRGAAAARSPGSRRRARSPRDTAWPAPPRPSAARHGAARTTSSGRRSSEVVTAIRGRVRIWTYISAAGGLTP